MVSSFIKGLDTPQRSRRLSGRVVAEGTRTNINIYVHINGTGVYLRIQCKLSFLNMHREPGAASFTMWLSITCTVLSRSTIIIRIHVQTEVCKTKKQMEYGNWTRPYEISFCLRIRLKYFKVEFKRGFVTWLYKRKQNKHQTKKTERTKERQNDKRKTGRKKRHISIRHVYGTIADEINNAKFETKQNRNFFWWLKNSDIKSLRLHWNNFV